MVVWMSTCLHTSSQHHSKLSIEWKAGWKGEQLVSTDGIFSLGLMSAYRRRDETRRRGMALVKKEGVQNGGVQTKVRRRRNGREIQAKEMVRLSRIGRPRLRPRFLLEMQLTRRKTGLAEVRTAQQSSRVLARSMATAQEQSSSSLPSGQSMLPLHQSILRMQPDLSAQGRL